MLRTSAKAAFFVLEFSGFVARTCARPVTAAEVLQELLRHRRLCGARSEPLAAKARMALRLPTYPSWPTSMAQARTKAYRPPPTSWRPFCTSTCGEGDESGIGNQQRQLHGPRPRAVHVDRSRLRARSGTFGKPLVDWDRAPAPVGATVSRSKLMTYRIDVLRFLPIDANTKKQSLTTGCKIRVPDAGCCSAMTTNQHETGPRRCRGLGASLVVVYRDRTKPFRDRHLRRAYVKRRSSKMEQPIAGSPGANGNPSVKDDTHIAGDGGPLRSERVYVGTNLIATIRPGTAGPAGTIYVHRPVGAVEGRGRHHGDGGSPRPDSGLSVVQRAVFRTTVQDSDKDGPDRHLGIVAVSARRPERPEQPTTGEGCCRTSTRWRGPGRA